MLAYAQSIVKVDGKKGNSAYQSWSREIRSNHRNEAARQQFAYCERLFCRFRLVQDRRVKVRILQEGKLVVVLVWPNQRPSAIVSETNGLIVFRNIETGIDKKPSLPSSVEREAGENNTIRQRRCRCSKSVGEQTAVAVADMYNLFRSGNLWMKFTSTEKCSQLGKELKLNWGLNLGVIIGFLRVSGSKPAVRQCTVTGGSSRFNIVVCCITKVPIATIGND